MRVAHFMSCPSVSSSWLQAEAGEGRAGLGQLACSLASTVCQTTTQPVTGVGFRARQKAGSGCPEAGRWRTSPKDCPLCDQLEAQSCQSYA